MNGRVLHFTRRELQRFLWSRNVIVLLSLAIFLITMANPILFASIPGFGSRLFYWSVCAVIYLLLAPGWATLVCSGWFAAVHRPIPQPLISMLLVCGLTWLAAKMPLLLHDWAPQRGFPITARTYLRNILIAQMIENMALFWLLPLFRKDIRPSGETSPAPETPSEHPIFVTINRANIPLNTLLSVQSAGHYLHVTTDSGTQEYHARMKDFLEQVDEAAGISPHRSHWVATRAAQSHNGKHIRLGTGATIPIARGKQAKVRDWAQHHGIEAE
jgi:hypothetical protein